MIKTSFLLSLILFLGLIMLSSAPLAMGVAPPKPLPPFGKTLPSTFLSTSEQEINFHTANTSGFDNYNYETGFYWRRGFAPHTNLFFSALQIGQNRISENLRFLIGAGIEYLLMKNGAQQLLFQAELASSLRDAGFLSVGLGYRHQALIVGAKRNAVGGKIFAEESNYQYSPVYLGYEFWLFNLKIIYSIGGHDRGFFNVINVTIPP